MNSEQQIWQKLINDDINSLKELYLMYRNTFIYYGRKITNDQQLIEDAIQETFISIWKYRHSLSIPSGVKQYVLKAFRNQLFQIFKDRSNIIYTEESLNFSFEISFDSKIIEGEDAEKLSAQINNAINKLTNRQREIIYYRFYENLSFEEIATIMNMQIRATYKLSTRAITALRDIMGASLFNLFLLI
ncbi:MAG: sigma-70 family RNA polymerase sigma factor [Ginsengibacter sp.]